MRVLSGDRITRALHFASAIMGFFATLSETWLKLNRLDRKEAFNIKVFLHDQIILVQETFMTLAPFSFVRLGRKISDSNGQSVTLIS